MPESEFTPEDIVDLYVDHTPEEIAEITNWKLYLIYQALHELDIDIRPQGRIAVLENPGKEYLISLQKHGLSQQDIANLKGVSKRTVQRWLKE